MAQMKKTSNVNEPDITSDLMRNHQTFNTCPECGKEWETIPAIPGVLHKTRLCNPCKGKKNRKFRR